MNTSYRGPGLRSKRSDLRFRLFQPGQPFFDAPLLHQARGWNDTSAFYPHREAPTTWNVPNRSSRPHLSSPPQAWIALLLARKTKAGSPAFVTIMCCIALLIFKATPDSHASRPLERRLRHPRTAARRRARQSRLLACRRASAYTSTIRRRTGCTNRSGQIQFAFFNYITGSPQAANGRLVPVAIAEAKRNRRWPGVRTVSEAYSGFEVTFFIGVSAPRSVPAATVAKLQRAIEEAQHDPRFKDPLESVGPPFTRQPPGE